MSRILNSICITVIFISSTSCTTQVKTPTAGWEQLPQILREIKAPEFPDREFDITRFGAISNGKTYMRNVTVGEVSDAILKINYYYGEKDTGEFTPTVRNINMENVTSNKSDYAIRIEAYPRSPVTGLHLKNCTFNNVAKGNIWEGVKDAQFVNVTINGQLKEADD